MPLDPSIETLVKMAMGLRCTYPTDPCVKHLREEGFITCQPCNTRALADTIAKRHPGLTPIVGRVG